MSVDKNSVNSLHKTQYNWSYYNNNSLSELWRPVSPLFFGYINERYNLSQAKKAELAM